MFVLSKILRRSQRLSSGVSRAASAKLGVTSSYIVDKAGDFDLSAVAIYEKSQIVPNFFHTNYGGSSFSVGFASKAGAKSDGEEDHDLEDGFSELEVTEDSEGEIEDGLDSKLEGSDGEIEDGLDSKLEISGDEDENDETEELPHNELELSDSETAVTETKASKKKASSALLKAIMDAPGTSVAGALDKWAEQGKEFTRTDVSLAMLNLRKRRMYGRALQLSEWLEANNKLEFVERDYASRVDLIAKLHGLQKAEAYIAKIPKSFRGEVIYRTLLANCVVSSNVKKAEEVFNKMKDLGFPLTAFACNQLLLLYKRLDKKKIADVLLLMEKENVKPTVFTYMTLIDTKGYSNDIAGMDQIVETMKAEGIEPDMRIKSILAKHYAAAGLKEKALSVLKDMEGESLKVNRWVCRSLIPLYGELGNTDEVERIWTFCEANPQLEECLSAIQAWGKLKKVDKAEAVFEKMSKTWKRLTSRHYSVMLKVYAEHKMLAEGKDLVKRMADNGCIIGPLTWDALVKLYVESGEVEKADAMLNKASQQSKVKPMFNSYMTIMDQYSKRGDIHNCEKMFHRMRQAGYVARFRQFQSLMQTYVNAKVPAYGMRERMKADNVFPNRALAAQLAEVDAFRKTAVSDLLD